MPLSDSIFINQFQKGAEENSNLGIGTMLGVENYTVKGVARLTKDTVKVSGSVVTDLPVYFTAHTATQFFAQGDTGKVYISNDSGATWTDMTNASGSSSGAGQGLMWYNGYLFAFRGGKIDYTSGTTTSWTQTDWQPNGAAPGIIGSPNFPFIFPNDGSMYFTNGYKVGKIGTIAGTTFNPAGTGGTNYIYSNGTTNTTSGTVTFGLTLPSIYNVNCISFLPSNYLALGLGSSGVGNLAAGQIADIVLWNPTLSTYETPLRLFSQAGAGLSGVNQIINRNNVLYAVTGGNHAVFSTNGTSFTLVDDISIMMTSRLTTGTGVQSTAPLFLNPYPSAIGVLGNKLYTGTSTSISSQPSGYGTFPLGVWSTAFLDSGHSTQCEFPISTGTVTAASNFFIGAIFPVSQNQVLIGWKDGSTFGIDKSDFTNFQTDPSVVQIESQMMEIGTPLEPSVITTIQLNLVRSLMEGQTISVYWRNAFDRPYALLKTFTSADGDVQLNNSLKITSNNMNAIKFLQLRIEMSTGSPNQAWTPELRNVIITGK